MKAAPTKAPWIARPEESGNWEIKDEKGNWVARVHFRNGPADGEAKANADLIAAAPEMYEALCGTIALAVVMMERHPDLQVEAAIKSLALANEIVKRANGGAA